MKYDDRMDQECVPICDALNRLTGIATFESCCGHGKHPMWIFFTARRMRDLRPILDALPTNGRAGWKITATQSSARKIYFCLEGPCLPDRHSYWRTSAKNQYAQANEIAEEINDNCAH